MSDLLNSILFGIVQGLTEFLPISSSGHLVLLHDYLHIGFEDNLSFDVVLHLGSLLSLFIFFGKDVYQLIVGFFKSLAERNFKEDVNQRMPWYIIVASIPAAIMGFFLENQIETIFRNSFLVAVMLISFGILLYIADKFAEKTKDIKDIKFKSAFIIGLAQSLALIPGVSRSGITIITGLSQKLNRQAAAKFSFLLSMPVVFGAGVKKILDLITTGNLYSSDITILIVGFLSSAITGYLCIKYFLKFLQNHSLKIFAYYRIILGVIIILVFLSS